jgi:DNA-binding transcriptional LysR family regulator
MTDWDDYRFFLAVADEGSLSAAARKLGSSQPTVGRRIAALEERLEVRLFAHQQQGFVLTPSGEVILEFARRLEASHREINLWIKGQGSRLVGTVKVSASESMSIHWLIPRLSRFRSLYPDIRIEVHLDSAQADISRGQADIALRFGRPGEDDVLLARKVGRAEFGLFGSAAYFHHQGMPHDIDDLKCHAIIGAAGRLGDTSIPEWLDGVIQSEVLACNSMLGVLAAVEQDLGLGILPIYVVQPERSLKRVLDADFKKFFDLWLVVHPHTRGAANIRAVLNFLAEEVAKDPLLAIRRKSMS